VGSADCGGSSQQPFWLPISPILAKKGPGWYPPLAQASPPHARTQGSRLLSRPDPPRVLKRSLKGRCLGFSHVTREVLASGRGPLPPLPPPGGLRGGVDVLQGTHRGVARRPMRPAAPAPRHPIPRRPPALPPHCRYTSPIPPFFIFNGPLRRELSHLL